MGNVCAKTKKGPHRKVTLAIVGLDNAGKTVTTKGLQGATFDGVAPTIGFSNVDFKFNGHDITIFDLGGGKKIRDIWKNYYGEVYALVIVIDASDGERMEECRHVIGNTLDNQHVRGKPVLILANKQDKEGALDEIDICEGLRLEEQVNTYKSPCRVETCSAIKGHGKKMDPAINKGFTWLINTVDNMWDKLHTRIERDMKEKKERDDKERSAKLERVRKIREERAKKEEAERRLRGEDDPASDHEGDFTDGTDPFKRLNYDELAKKDAALKAAKKREKELEASRGHSISEDEPPRLSRRNRKPVSEDDEDDDSDDDGDDDDDDDVPQQKAIRSSQAPKTHSALDSRHLNGHSTLGTSSPRLSRRPLDPIDSEKGTPRPYALQPLTLTPRGQGLGVGEEEVEERFKLRSRKGLAPLAPLQPLAPLEPIDNGKKKKKKAKKNQTVPGPSASDEDESDYHPKTNPLAPRGWNTPPAARSLLKASKSPGLATLKEPENDESDDDIKDFSAKWGLDLPDAGERGTMRPNYDYDDLIT